MRARNLFVFKRKSTDTCRAHAANLQQRVCCCGPVLRQTDGRTDTVPFHRPCTAYCTGGVDKRWVCWWFRSANWHELASYSSNWRQQPGGKSPSGTACIVGEHASVVLSVRCPLHNSQSPLAPTATDSPLFSTSARRRLP